MSDVLVTGDLPPMGAEAVRLTEQVARPRVARAVEITNQEIERQQPGSPGRMSTPEVTETAGEISGESFPTDFKFRWFMFGTGEHNKKRGTPIGPKRGRKAKSGSKRDAGLKFADGRVRRTTKGMKGRNFVAAGKRVARARVEAELEGVTEDFVRKATS